MVNIFIPNLAKYSLKKPTSIQYCSSILWIMVESSLGASPPPPQADPAPAPQFGKRDIGPTPATCSDAADRHQSGKHTAHPENGCFQLQHRCSADSKPSPCPALLLPSIFPLSVNNSLPPQKNNIMEKFICPLGVHVVYLQNQFSL